MTVSYAQNQKDVKDTVKCYGITDLRNIASAFVELEACDTLLSNAKSMLVNRDSLIKQKDIELFKQYNQLMLKEKIIVDNHQQIDILIKQLNTVKNHRKLLVIGWGSSTLLLAGIMVYLAIH